jgi:protease-4
MASANLEKQWENLRGALLWLALPLLAGLLLAALIPQPVIGILHLDSAIEPYSASLLSAQITYAREHPEIRAVVLVLDSPGGTVSDTEAVYLDLLNLRKTKPVVASINSMAASGAYYLTAGTDYAFAKPTSEVGNIGVIGYLPPSPTIFESIISTGPYKLWGTPRDAYVRQIEMIKQEFYEAVKTGRGSRLKAPSGVVLSGQIWPGTEALHLGLIDELGAQSEAIEKAASLAKVSNYKTVNLAELALTPSPYGGYTVTKPENSPAGAYPTEAGLYLLYLPPSFAEQK